MRRIVTVICLLCMLAILEEGLLFSDGDHRFYYQKKERKDPFVPLLGKGADYLGTDVLSLGDLILEGVIFDPTKGSLAVVNGRVMRVGEKIGEFKLLRILPNEVAFSHGGLESSVKMYRKEES